MRKNDHFETLKKIEQLSPIIVVGMHRSGTSLLSRLFNELGIHMGRWLSRDAESVYFQRINRSIYDRVGAQWAEPENLIAKLQSPDFIQEQTRQVQSRLIQPKHLLSKQPSIASNFQLEFWPRVLNDPGFFWGWKDPRTALVIPIWANVFPNAKWIHIVRNGIDVAISLYRRAYRQQKKLLLRLYRFDFSERTLDFDYDFNLWETYLDSITHSLSEIDSERWLQIRYEDLLANPHELLQEVLKFIEYPVDQNAVNLVSQQVNRKRLDNSQQINKHKSLIEKLPPSARMEQLGYLEDIS